MFLIQESTVLTSKCNSAPQAAVISSVIMAENGREGNQINTSMMDRWMAGMLVMSAFTLCPFLTCDSISSNSNSWMLNCKEQASAAYESLSHTRRGYMQAHANRKHLHVLSISIHYPRRRMGLVREVARVSFANSSSARHRSFLTLEPGF